jgi:osomolarity two-component system phosphorelay intermediate protein YPD1
LNLHDHSDILDYPTFEQILEMDDDENEREFSRGIVYDFFQQADNTFQKMGSSLYSPFCAPYKSKD